MKVYLICVLAFILADILSGLVKSLYEKTSSHLSCGRAFFTRLAS